jgi:CheY-like chemotaxis protein
MTDYAAGGHRQGSREPKNRLLLLVDGNPRDLFTTGMILQRLEYDVYVRQRRGEALQVMDNALPTLVVADAQLPQMSGIELLNRMRQGHRTKAIPFILQTATTDPKIEDLCLAYGYASILKKPLEPDTLYRAIQRVTETTPRHYVRLRTFLRVVVGGRGPDGLEARSRAAISENGIYAKTLTPWSVNVHPVEFMISRRLIKARVVVLYSFSLDSGPFREPGMGMQFIDIADADRELIRDFIKGQITKDISMH